MSPELLREVIANGETLDVEFKGESARQMSDADLVEAVVCLANRPGDRAGWLLIGVEDDGSVSGARPRHGMTTDPSRLLALIANRTRPSLTCDVEVVRSDHADVITIAVPAARTPVGTADGRYVRRAMGGMGRPECIPFHYHEMQSAQAARGSLDYSALVVADASWDDLDPLEFERFRSSIRETRGVADAALLQLTDVELAKALGAIDANHSPTGIRVLALLLFGKESALQRFIPTHEVAFQVLSGTSVEVNDFFRAPLLRLMQEILGRFRARNREEEVMAGLFRIGIPDYPERAFREALANAVTHRDFTHPGAVHVQWHSDRIEISNPGGFPEGVRLDNLLVTPPRPRNPLLADAFKRAGVVERTGRGIDTIFEEQLRSGRPAPSYERSTESDVVVVLPGGEADRAFVKFAFEESEKGRRFTLDDLLIMSSLWQERRLSVAEVGVLVQKPETEARRSLQRLVEAGLVEARGDRKGRTYHLSAASYRRLGKKAAYVRQRGFEPLQQDQMVLQYVEKHGRITRAEVAELCQLSSAQARAVLRRLVRRRQLVARGQRRAAYYELAPKVMDASKHGAALVQKLGPKAQNPAIRP